MKKCLHLGNGTVYLSSTKDKEWINIDMVGKLAKDYPELADRNRTTIEKYYKFPFRQNKDNNVTDVIMDVRKLKFADESVDEILCVNLIDHMKKEEFLETLKEWKRVLKTGGQLIIDVDDRQKQAEILTSAETNEEIEWALRLIYCDHAKEGRTHFWGYCYDTKTEILTKDGWKLFKDLNHKDLIATLNKCGYLEYHKPNGISKRQYNGRMIKLQGRSIDLVVTPNHKLYVKKNRVKNSKYELIVANKVFKMLDTWKFKKNALWVGKKINYFILSSVTKYKNKKIIPERKISNINSWLSFLGWFISEGYIGAHGRNKFDYRIGICQSLKNSQYRNEIRECLDKLDFKYKEYKDEFGISDKQLWSYLIQFGKAKNKFVPSFIKDMPPKQILIFLNSLFKGDGNGVIERGKNCNFYSGSIKLINDVQELLLKCGLSGNVKKHKNRESSYRINVINSSSASLRLESNGYVLKKPKERNIKHINYNGIVYCCNVQNHIIYVRRNGKGCWCGNSPSYLQQILENNGFKFIWEKTDYIVHSMYPNFQICVQK